jgi:hypothetical protein
MYGTDLSDNENAEFIVRMFVNLLAELITQGVSKIHEEFSKFFCADYFKDSLEEIDSPLAALHVIQDCFIIIQNRCAQATGEHSILVIEAASQRPETQKEIRAQELAIDMQSTNNQQFRTQESIISDTGACN